MPEEKKGIKVRFERQRRNLMAISVTMVVYFSLGLEFNKLNVLGNTVTISNAANIEQLLWVLFLYFLSRYYHFYNVIDNREFIPTYDICMDKYVRPVALKALEHTDLPTRKDENPEGRRFSYKLTEARVYNILPWRWELKLDGNIEWNIRDGKGGQPFKDFSITVSGTQLLWPKIKARSKLYLATPHVSEYLLPFWLAAFAVGCKILSWS